ncbi:MAG: hypothetical protein C4345_07265, partial [Chloroflexota bacterium]
MSTFLLLERTSGHTPPEGGRTVVRPAPYEAIPTMTRERTLIAGESALHLPGPDGHAEARTDADAAHAALEAA